MRADLVEYHAEGVKTVKLGNNTPNSDLYKSPLVSRKFPVLVLV